MTKVGTLFGTNPLFSETNVLVSDNLFANSTYVRMTCHLYIVLKLVYIVLLQTYFGLFSNHKSLLRWPIYIVLAYPLKYTLLFLINTFLQKQNKSYVSRSTIKILLVFYLSFVSN